MNDCESAAMSNPALAFKFVEAVITPVELAIVIAAVPSSALIAPVSIEVRHECYTAVMTAPGGD